VKLAVFICGTEHTRIEHCFMDKLCLGTSDDKKGLPNVFVLSRVDDILV
jgi:hypothetical protein